MVRLREELKESLIKQERERRRILRLKQVRQQIDEQAKIIRKNVTKKKQEIINDVRVELEMDVCRVVSSACNSEAVKNVELLKNSDTLSTEKMKINQRRRPITEEDLQKAYKRNDNALKKLRDKKKQELLEKEQRLRRRKEAERIANQILKRDQK